MKITSKTAIFFLVSLLSLSASSCSGGGIAVPGKEVLVCEDNYRTMYQIFPISFADSNGDGKGDLNGITAKVDYLADLNYNGVWLTPVHPSSSYHKYDVDDYYDIDDDFGTLEDYDNMVKAFHDKGMTVILDLVLNHSSDSISWFTQSCQAHMRSLTSNQYYEYYVIEDVPSSGIPTGYYQVPGSSSLMYQGVFWDGMPDLNLQAVLDNPEGNLATEIKNIMKFWLVDHNVDGFRLDAITSYFSTGAGSGQDVEKNAQFLKWLTDTARELKEDAYIIAEGSWSAPTENLTYIRDGGLNSCFNFEASQSGGFIGSSTVRGMLSPYYNGLKSTIDLTADIDYGVPAPFISNHDVSRLTGATASSNGENAHRAKFAYGLLQMLTGVTWNYYGDEIGMAIVSNPNSESIGDENRRQPLYWGEGDSYNCTPVSGTYTGATDEAKYPYGSVASQLEDPNSLLAYVKQANTLRNQYSAIAHGTYGSIYEINDLRNGLVFNKTYGDEDLLFVMNGSSTSTYTFDYSSVGNYSTVVGHLEAREEYASVSGTTLSLPPLSIVIVK